jgi:hypothetical protein
MNDHHSDTGRQDSGEESGLKHHAKEFVRAKHPVFHWSFVAVPAVVLIVLTLISVQIMSRSDRRLEQLVEIALSAFRDRGSGQSSISPALASGAAPARPSETKPKAAGNIRHFTPPASPQQSNPAQPALVASATSHTATPTNFPPADLATKPVPATPSDLRTVIEDYFRTQIENRQSDRRFLGLRLVLAGDPTAWEIGNGVDECEISFRVIDGDQRDVMPSDTLKEMASSRDLNAHDLQARACFYVIDKIIYRIGLS